MGNCKTKAIQTDLDTFRHNQEYSKPCVNLAYSEPWYTQNADIFKTRNILIIQVSLELAYIENSGIFKTRDLFRHLRCQTFSMKRFVKTVNGKQFRNISLPHSLFHETNIIRQLLQRLSFFVKKAVAHERVEDREILIYLLIYSNKLAYLQPITVLVYGNSSPKSHEQDYLNFQQKL